MPTIIPSYCNPFFHRCKHFFQFFENIFNRSKGKPDYFTDYFPKSGKNTPQHPSRKDTPSQSPKKHCSKVSNPEFSPADRKGMDQPKPCRQHQKYTVRQCCEPRSEGPQKLITQAQQHANDQSCAKPLGSQFRCCHPSSRRSRDPFCRCCS